VVLKRPALLGLHARGDDDGDGDRGQAGGEQAPTQR
jgi:hypothetical protein